MLFSWIRIRTENAARSESGLKKKAGSESAKNEAESTALIN